MMPPAAMPSEEEIKDILLRFHADTASAWRHERDGIATFAARAILALFAPILAEKEREISNLSEAVKVRAHEAVEYAEQRNRAQDRALAAEAALAELRKQMLADEGQHREALAAERERCAKIAEADVVGMSCFMTKEDWAEQPGLRLAAAIRAQGEFSA